MSAAFLTRVVVLAKAPVAGRCKTRLTPPYTPDQAAAVAQACLQDTLDVVRALAEDTAWEALLCLDGEPGSWRPAGMPVVPQCQGGHDVRIAHAIESGVRTAGLPAADAVLLIGMDTPQVTGRLLRSAARELRYADAVLGPAQDGGWWLLGLRGQQARRATELIVGVPTSRADTGALQRQRLNDCGLSVRSLSVLRDIDTAADIDVVLGQLATAPRTTRFARLARELNGEAAA